MLKNYIISSLRNAKAKPFIYLLNVAGLAMGIAAFLFIAVYARHEYSFDQFHENADRIYRIDHIMKQEGKDDYRAAATFPRVGPALVEEFDQVQAACRLVQAYNGGIGIVDNTPIEHEQMIYAEPSFFELFSFPMVYGDPKTALEGVHKAVLSEEVAVKHFGTDKVVGKLITFQTIEGERTYEVTGVFDNSNPTHIEVEVLLSFTSLTQAWGPGTDMNWRWFDFITYVLLKPETDLEALDKSFVAFIDKHGGENKGSDVLDFDLMPLTDIHLKSNINQEITANGDIRTVNFLLLIGSFIIVIAWVNYINLYTARATERGKEVGIRKALGSSRLSLIAQFFTEAMLINLLAVLIGFTGFVILSFLADTYLAVKLPPFMSIASEVALLLVVLWLISFVFSGTYPSVFVSNFKILSVLKGKSSGSQGVGLRKALVTFQFMASSFMIGGTILVFSQLQFMNSQPMGVDISDTIVLEIPDYSGDGDSYFQSVGLLTNEILNISGVEEVSSSSDVPGKQVGWRGSSWVLSKPNDRKIVYKMTVDENYLSFLKANFLAGRNFLDEGDSLSFIINEEALSFYGFSSPEEAINKRVRFAGLDTLKIVGVIANFYQESLRETFKPTAYLRINDEIQFMSIRLKSTDVQATLQEVETKFNNAFSSLPFTYHFMDDLMLDRHKNEDIFNKLFNAFSILAIFISFLGLLGLAYYTTTKRRKEAGIRKVLGSSSASIIRLVFKDFAKLVVLGNVIMVPALWRLSVSWLNQFSFHVDFSWLTPLATLGISLSFAFVFTYFHLSKLAKTNPTEVLKYE